MALKEIVVVFNKEQSDKVTRQQIEFLSKWARKNYIWCGRYKDNTMQARAVGSHCLVKIEEDKIDELKSLINAKFTYTESDNHRRSLIHTFDLMVDPELNSYTRGYVANTVEEFEMIVSEFEKTITDRQKVEVERDPMHFTNVRPRKQTPNSFTEWVTVTTERDAEFTPEALLTEEGLALAMNDKSDNPRVVELTTLIDETIDLYNNANNACGRINYIPTTKQAEWKDKDQLAQYLIRERASATLIKYRRELGKIKAAQTRAAKKGIDNKVDFKKYSIV